MEIGDKKPVVMESDRAVPGGMAALDESGKLAAGQRPDYTTSQVEGLDEQLSSLGERLSGLDEHLSGLGEQSFGPGSEVETLQTGKQGKLMGDAGKPIGIGDDGAAGNR